MNTLRNNFVDISISFSYKETINLCNTNKEFNKICFDVAYWKVKASANYDYDLTCITANRTLSQKYFLLEKMMQFPLTDPLFSRANNIYFWNKKFKYFYGINDMINKSNINSIHLFASILENVYQNKFVSWHNLQDIFHFGKQSLLDVIIMYGMKNIVDREHITILSPQQQETMARIIKLIVGSTPNIVINELAKSEDYDGILLYLNQFMEYMNVGVLGQSVEAQKFDTAEFKTKILNDVISEISGIAHYKYKKNSKIPKNFIIDTFVLLEKWQWKKDISLYTIASQNIIYYEIRNVIPTIIQNVILSKKNIENLLRLLGKTYKTQISYKASYKAHYGPEFEELLKSK